MNLFSTVFLLTALALLTLCLVVLTLKVLRYERTLYDFVMPQAEGKQSPLADALDAIAARFGRAVAMEVKTTLMGKASGMARQIDAAANEVAVEGAQAQFPAMANIFEAVPSLRKRAGKNAALLQLGLAALSKMGFNNPEPVGSAQGNGHTPSGDSGSYADRLNKYR